MGCHHLPVKLSQALLLRSCMAQCITMLQHLISPELNLCWPGLYHISLEKNLSARVIGFRAKAPCSACAAPNRYIVHYHEFYPKFLSQVDVSFDVLGESDLLQETASDISKYMVHETSITTDSGYHSPHPTVPAHLDVSRGYMGAGSANPKVHCPFSQGESLVSLPGEMGEIPSPVLCEDTGHPEVKIPGQMLPLASTPRVNGENIANTASMFASSWESETFGEPNYPTPWNCIVPPIKEKMLPSPIEFPAQSLTASHPTEVDADLEDMLVKY